ncbi:MAG: hypothetical protein AAFO98_12605 [Pseudomonadota bacterium]
MKNCGKQANRILKRALRACRLKPVAFIGVFVGTAGSKPMQDFTVFPNALLHWLEVGLADGANVAVGVDFPAMWA